MKTKVKLFAIIIALILMSSCVSLTSSFIPADKLYLQARQFVKEGRQDFAFLNLNELLRTYPQYRFAAEAKFALAEYSFLQRDYNKALSELVSFLNNYPQHKAAVFAKVFLYVIVTDKAWLTSEEATRVAQTIKEEFFANPAFFVFSEFKEKRFTSLLGNFYVLKEYVDKIDIFANGKPLLSVSP